MQPCKDHGEKAPRILNFCLDRGEWLASRSCRFVPRGNFAGVNWIGVGGCVHGGGHVVTCIPIARQRYGKHMRTMQ
jgi:hypothetical protein